MNNLFRSMLAATALIAAATPAMCAAPGNEAAVAKQTIQHELNLSNAAFAHRDIPGVYRFFAPGYTRIGDDGKTYNLAADEASARQFMTVMKSISAKTTVTQCALRGGKAYATVVLASTVGMKQSPTAPLVHVVDDEVRLQTWVRSGASWLLLTSHNKSTLVIVHTPGQADQVFVNGKRTK